MAHVIFFEKTGCAGNASQKKLLEASGHKVLARDLRNKDWTNLALLEFFIGLPVAQWFNPSAPAIKAGDIVPAELDEATALALLRDNPLLIRRPLLQVGDERKVGFDATAIHAWIGLRNIPAEDLEACQRAVPEPPPEPQVFYAHTASGAAFRCKIRSHTGAPTPDADGCQSD